MDADKIKKLLEQFPASSLKDDFGGFSFDSLSSNRTIQPSQQDKEKFEAAKTEARTNTSSQSGFLHFQFDRTLTGKELAESLKTSLEERGIDPDCTPSAHVGHGA